MMGNVHQYSCKEDLIKHLTRLRKHRLLSSENYNRIISTFQKRLDYGDNEYDLLNRAFNHVEDLLISLPNNTWLRYHPKK
jgi:hypothetical protein